MVSRSCALLLLSILAECSAEVPLHVDVPSAEDPLPLTFHVKHQPHPEKIDALGARVLARRNAIVKSLGGSPKGSLPNVPIAPAHSSHRNVPFVKDESAVANVAQRLQRQEDKAASPIMQHWRPREIAVGNLKTVKAVASSAGMKVPMQKEPGSAHGGQEHHIAPESRSVETVPGASSLSAPEQNTTNITDAVITPDLGRAMKQIIAINGTMNLALGTVQLIGGKAVSTKRKSESLCGIVEIDHLEVCTWFKQYEASLTPQQLHEFEEHTPEFHGSDSAMLAVCNRLYSHTCLADPTAVCDQATACSYVPVCTSYKDMLPAVPVGTILGNCAQEPAAGVKELWGGAEILNLMPTVPPNGEPVEAGQQQMKMVLSPAYSTATDKGGKQPAPAAQTVSKDVDDADDAEDEEAMEDIEDEDAAEEAGVERELKQAKAAMPSASPAPSKAKVVKAVQPPTMNRTAFRASLRKAVRDPVRGGAAAISGQTIPQHKSVSKEIEQAESAIKTAVKGVVDRTAVAVAAKLQAEQKEKIAKLSGSPIAGKAHSETGWTDANIRSLEDMTSFWNKVTDSAAAVLNNVDANSTGTDKEQFSKILQKVMKQNTSAVSTTRSLTTSVITHVSKAASATTTTATTTTTTKAATLTQKPMLNAKTTRMTTTQTTTTAAKTKAITTTITSATMSATPSKDTSTTLTEAVTTATTTTKAGNPLTVANASVSATTTTTTTTTTRAQVSNATIAAQSFDAKAAANAIMAKEQHVEAVENRLEAAIKDTLGNQNKDDTMGNQVSASTADVEVDDFTPLALNSTSSTSSKHGNATEKQPSQSVPPPWESGRSNAVTYNATKASTASVDENVTIPPWLSEGIDDHPRMLNAKRVKSVDPEAGRSDVKVSQTRRSHTIRDAIKASLNKDGTRKKSHSLNGEENLHKNNNRKHQPTQTQVPSKKASVTVNQKRHTHTIKDAIKASLSNDGAKTALNSSLSLDAKKHKSPKKEDQKHQAVKTKVPTEEKKHAAAKEDQKHQAVQAKVPTEEKKHAAAKKKVHQEGHKDLNQEKHKDLQSEAGKTHTFGDMLSHYHKSQSEKPSSVASSKKTVLHIFPASSPTASETTSRPPKTVASLKRIEKDENVGRKRHTIKDAITKAINAVKVDEQESEKDDDEDEDDEGEEEDDEDGEDDEDSDDDEDSKAGKSKQESDKEESDEEDDDDDDDDDDSLLQSAPWVGMQ